MEGKTWTVVQFLDDSTVEAIPSSWIQGNNCHWPSFAKDKLFQAIRKSEPLNTCWPTHSIKIFRNATFGEFILFAKGVCVPQPKSGSPSFSLYQIHTNDRHYIQNIECFLIVCIYYIECSYFLLFSTRYTMI